MIALNTPLRNAEAQRARLSHALRNPAVLGIAIPKTEPADGPNTIINKDIALPLLPPNQKHLLLLPDAVDDAAAEMASDDDEGVMAGDVQQGEEAMSIAAAAATQFYEHAGSFLVIAEQGSDSRATWNQMATYQGSSQQQRFFPAVNCILCPLSEVSCKAKGLQRCTCACAGLCHA